jgi:ABC-type thiamine transport system substrate-binding protein
VRHNQQQVPSQSVQAPDANNSSLNDTFTVVAKVFQQIMTKLNGAESEEDRIMAITKTVLKLM